MIGPQGLEELHQFWRLDRRCKCLVNALIAEVDFGRMELYRLPD